MSEKIVLVVPSNRGENLQKFLDAWRDVGDWHEVVLVEDNAHRRFQPRSRWPLHHYSHHEISQRLGQAAWIISKKDSACRAFGFLIARELGARWILTLDDDCYPRDTPICERHLAAMHSHVVCQPSCGTRTRGMPYRNLGLVECKLNMGLWAGNADLDGPQGLLDTAHFTPPTGSKLANPLERYPLCGMNLMFSVDLLPALYFPPMGDGQLFRRFDDIWCGWLFQKIAQQCGVAWSMGEPCVEHVRASDPFVNLVKEAPGIAANERVWEQISAIKLSGMDVAGCVAQIGEHLRWGRDPYLSTWGRALGVWLRWCGEASLSPEDATGATRRPRAPARQRSGREGQGKSGKGAART